jgi:hypothetical protein
MTAKEFIKSEIDRAGASVFARAKKVPADKLEWSPLDHGRSVMNLVQECALCPSWTVDVLKTKKFESDPNESMAEYEAARAAITDLDSAEAAFNKNVADLKAAIDGFPEGEMLEEITIPWGTFSYADLMFVPAWNCHYHVGQINYIQTLYGDKDM